MESVSKRYAQALFDIAKEEDKVSEYRTEAMEIYQTLKQNPELLHLLSSYFLTEQDKDETVDKVYQSIRLEKIKTFIKVICQHGRAYMMLRIFRQFHSLADMDLHIASGIIYSAQKLSEEQISSISQAISEKEKIKAELTNQIDPSLIGGIKVVVRDKVMDYSLQSALEGLKEELTHGGTKHDN